MRYFLNFSCIVFENFTASIVDFMVANIRLLSVTSTMKDIGWKALSKKIGVENDDWSYLKNCERPGAHPY